MLPGFETHMFALSTTTALRLGDVWVHVEPSLDRDGQALARLCQKVRVYRGEAKEGYGSTDALFEGWGEGILTDVCVYDCLIFICFGKNLSTTQESSQLMPAVKDSKDDLRRVDDARVTILYAQKGYDGQRSHVKAECPPLELAAW